MLNRMVETRKENVRQRGSEFFTRLGSQQLSGKTAAGTENWNLLVLVKALNERLKRRAESQDCLMSFANIQRFESQPSKHLGPQRFESQPRRASGSVDCAVEADETGPGG